MASSWKGALSVAGFPVNVALHSAVTKPGSDGFKMLAPNGQPIKQVYIDSDGKPVERAATSKGYERSKGDYVALTEAQVERIEAGQRSTIVEPMGFCPIDTVPLHLAKDTYEVIPDAKHPGAEQSVNVLWNGLRSKGVAYVTTITLRTRDSILAVWGDDAGLWAASLPFATEFAQVPATALSADDEAAAMLGNVIDSVGVTAFDHGAFVSEYAARRQRVIDEVLSGAPAVAVTADEAAPTEVPDLLAALKAGAQELATATAAVTA
jgi:DNA end-binding protein Ku